MKNKDKKIGIMVESDANFYAVKPLLSELRKKYENLAVLVIDWRGEKDGHHEMFASTKKLLQNEGYEPIVLNDCRGETFDLFLAPYLYGTEPINIKCAMKYSYGPLAMKPKLTHIPEMMEMIDVSLCEDTVNYELLKTYGATHLVDNLKFFGLKRLNGQHTKKHVLFAPTYNDEFEVQEIENAIKELKKKFYVVVKEHHGTSFLAENYEKKDVLEKEADEYYKSSDKNIAELIMEADACLLGNSATVGEAMYAGVPCAIFSKEMENFDLGNLQSTACTLTQKKIVPFTSQASKVNQCIELALSPEYRKKQSECANWLFPPESRSGVKGYMNIIDFYLNDELAKSYCDLHRYIVNMRRNKLSELRSENQELRNRLDLMKIKLNNEKNEVENLREIMNGGLHRIASRIYDVRYKIKSKD